MSAPFGSSANRCMGCQPARARTELDSSSADKKACDMNGLYGCAEVDDRSSGGAASRPPPEPFPCAGHGGLAQASQASADASPMALATRRVSSVVMAMADQVIECCYSVFRRSGL